MSYSRYGVNFTASLTLENGQEVEVRLTAPSCKLVDELVGAGLLAKGRLYRGVDLLVEDKPKKGRPPKRRPDTGTREAITKKQRTIQQPHQKTLSIWTEERVIMESTDIVLQQPTPSELGIAPVPSCLNELLPCEKHAVDQYINMEAFV